MPTWDEAADWYLGMLSDPGRGFNDLAADICLDLLGTVQSRHVLDIGCGEGHVARRLARNGAHVHGIEPVVALLQAAIEAETIEPFGIRYSADDAERLASVDSESVDLACALLVLHHVHDLAAAFTQAHRVLRPGGVLVAVQPHPWTDHPGATWTHRPEGDRRTIGDYTFEGFWATGNATTGQDITTVRDIGWNHHTVATWLTTLATTGFSLTDVREPVGTRQSRPDATTPWTDVPRFFAFRATKIP